MGRNPPVETAADRRERTPFQFKFSESDCLSDSCLFRHGYTTLIPQQAIFSIDVWSIGLQHQSTPIRCELNDTLT